MSEQTEADIDVELEAKTNKTFARIKGLAGKLASGGRHAQTATNALRSMAKAVEYSQWAKEQCIGLDLGKKKPDDLLMAKRVVEKGIRLLEECSKDFPQVESAFAGLKVKMIMQIAEIDAEIAKGVPNAEPN